MFIILINLYNYNIIANKLTTEDNNMYSLSTQISNYLFFCQFQKGLDQKTLKAYRIDLTQFGNVIVKATVATITLNDIEDYIVFLHQTYKPQTVKRKIASIKAFYHYLEYKDIISINPFNKLQIKLRNPIVLPKTIPLNTVEIFLKCIYEHHSKANTEHQFRTSLRDIAIIELLFATGIRISELCSLKATDVNLIEHTILIFGKGKKERRIHIGSDDVITILQKYYNVFFEKINVSNHFFINSNSQPISDQAVRRMIKKYTIMTGINMHITPHMFRHTFATCLLEADVDIRYIQEMLGHSSINITEIYTHVTTMKQGEILRSKHPRKNWGQLTDVIDNT